MSKVTEGKKQNPGFNVLYPGLNVLFQIVYSLTIRQLIFRSNKVPSQ